MRTAGVERSGIVGVLGVSRRDDIAAGVAGGASFVDDRDILLDWRKVGRFRPSYSSTLRSRTVDNNRLYFLGRPTLKIRSLASHELPSSTGNTLSRSGLAGRRVGAVTFQNPEKTSPTVIFSKVKFLPSGSPSLLFSPLQGSSFTSCYLSIIFSFLSLIPSSRAT
jgi:hypothetical protein